MNKLVSSFFGLSYLPLVPGVWASLPPVILYVVMAYLSSGQAACGWAVPAAMALMLVGTIWGSAYCGPAVIRQSDGEKPTFMVVDEAAGASLTMLLISLTAPRAGILVTALFGFGLFRIFHVLKLWPCKLLKKIPGRWVILADDLTAAMWAAGVWGMGRHLKTFVVGFVDLFGIEENMTAGFSLFLGMVQGLTEFLPVSSSGHLVFFESFSEKISTESPEMLLFDLCLHVGTVFSILVVFRARIIRFFGQLGGSVRSGLSLGSLYQKNAAVRFTVLAIVATITTAVFYVLFKDPLEASRNLLIVALMWLVTAGLLFAADYRHGNKGLRNFGILMAVVIGLSQGLAILPGISRSGATICAAILLGLKVRWAIEFSFLISIPAILGGAIVHTLQNFTAITNGDIVPVHLLIGIGSAFIVGIVSLKILIKVSKKRELKYFAVYCILISLVTVISYL